MGAIPDLLNDPVQGTVGTPKDVGQGPGLGTAIVGMTRANGNISNDRVSGIAPSVEDMAQLRQCVDR